VVRLACGEVALPAEIWSYRDAGRLNAAFSIVLVTTGVSERVRYRFWDPREGASALALPTAVAAGDDRATLYAISERCPRGPEIASRLLGAADWPTVAERGELLPRAGDEWVRTFASLSTDLPAGATPLAARLGFAFPGRRGLRTVVEGTLELAAPPGADSTFHLDGEVLRGDDLFDQFRYRFRAPAGSRVPFLFERPLRPGSYRFVMRLHDLAGERYFREERTVEVPVVGERRAAILTAAFAAAEAAAPAADGADAGEDGVDAAPAAAEPSLRLLAPLDRLVTGKVRIGTALRGEGIDAVSFSLDGRPVLRKRRPPFGVELDLGRSPQLHRVGAVAYDAQGVELARDEVLVNGGPHRFALRLIEPQAIPAGADRVSARAEVDVPEGETLDRVEFYVNDALYATLFQRPFLQALPVPRGADVAWIRAVAYLRGGGAAEDVRLVGSETLGDRIDVDFVELHASMLDRGGRPVADVLPSEVELLENGEPQQMQRFELVSDLPIHAGVLLDTSASMVEELYDAERAALQFFSEVLTERDRAAVITFADEPHLAVRFTSSVEVLAGGLADLEARGETNLWDSLAYALHYFSGIRGKRALVLISDGVDSGSRYRFDDVIEYARRTGVAIYVIGLNVPNRPLEAGMFIDRLARETGGRSFRISHAIELEHVYEQIRAELRAQYLVTYQSSGEGDGFREIELRVSRPGVEARTVRGYYP